MHPSPNIWRSSVIASTNRKKDGFFLNRRFRQEKSDIYVLYIINEIHEITSDRRDRGKTEKSRWPKKSSGIFGVKMYIFSWKKVIRENLFGGKFLSVPQNSAPCLRLCWQLMLLPID